MSDVNHETEVGKYYVGDTAETLRGPLGRELKGKVQLIFTSPPFPLNEKKSYGNLAGEAYKEWFTSLAEPFADLLTEDGSIVIELGNAWEPGRPVQSLLPLESLIGFVNNKHADLRLTQKLICYNPSRLPSPAQWVTVNRIRLTDSFTNLWWMAKCDYPKADNTRVLRPYSDSMKRLLKRQSYNAGARPSQHHISKESFTKDHGGSIAHNVLELEPMNVERETRLPEVFQIPENAMTFSNTNSNDHYHRTCRKEGIRPHPARMPVGLASFFIEFLTEPGDLVLDPFAGSNTTGYAAERLGRHWVAIEGLEKYAAQSIIRLNDPDLKERKVVHV